MLLIDRTMVNLGPKIGAFIFIKIIAFKIQLGIYVELANVILLSQLAVQRKTSSCYVQAEISLGVAT